jgi:nitroreductase
VHLYWAAAGSLLFGLQQAGMIGWWKRRRFKVLDRRTLIGGAGLALAGTGCAAYFALRQMGSMEEFKASVAATRSALSGRPGIHDLIRYATLAANSHNTQPWRFRISSGGIEILPDFSRRIPVVDPDDHHIFASLGCAAENLALAGRARNQPGDLRYEPGNGGSVIFTFGSGITAGEPLFDAIPFRQSTRVDFDGRAVSASDLKTLAAAAAIPGVEPIVITDRPQLERIRDLVVAGNTAQLADATFVRELRAWLRFSPREAMASADGLFSAATGNPILPAWLGPHMFDWVFKANAENEKYVRQLRSSAGVVVFVSQRDDPEHWVLAGRACQRFALQATALGLKHAFINQPAEVASLRPELAALVGMPGRRPDIVMRFGYGPPLPFSARRPVAAVLA